MIYYIVEENKFDDPKHKTHVKFIKIFVYHIVVDTINCCQLYEIIIVSKFMQ